jgi:uncharacterized LabA/DUF88 family protein
VHSQSIAKATGGMKMSRYLYIDGESHYIRSRKCWKSLHGEDAELNEVDYTGQHSDRPDFLPEFSQFYGRVDYRRKLLYVDSKVKFFFDASDGFRSVTPGFGAGFGGFERAVYFTSFSGDDDELYKKQVMIRELGLEPHIVHEDRQHADQRENTLANYNIIEKAKGVDIALTVRMIEDGYRHNYQQCFLFTSDIDYLPVIESVRRMGRQVFVFGYKDGLGKNSPMVYVPDRFIDLGAYMKAFYQRISKPQDAQE